MKRTTLLFILMVSINLFTQAETLTREDLEKELQPLKTSIQTLQNENKKLKTLNNDMDLKLKHINSKVIQLTEKTDSTNNTLNQATSKLGLQITNTESAANSKIQAIDDNLSKNTLWGIIGVLLAIILIGVTYFILNKKQREDKSDVIDQLSKTKSSIEESLVKEFGKQTELLETQLQLIEEQAKNQTTKSSNQEIDHSLALKVADEITLIERNISLMDKDVKGLKQLSRSVQKLKDNLNANGYEIPELLGKQFNQGMKLIVVSSIPDDNLNKGDEIISKIIKPQVNHGGKMIQAAQIEVSVG